MVLPSSVTPTILGELRLVVVTVLVKCDVDCKSSFYFTLSFSNLYTELHAYMLVKVKHFSPSIS